MGFSLWGAKVFDLSSEVTYTDAFITIAVVLCIALGTFLALRHKAQKP